MTVFILAICAYAIYDLIMFKKGHYHRRRTKKGPAAPPNPLSGVFANIIDVAKKEKDNKADESQEEQTLNTAAKRAASEAAHKASEEINEEMGISAERAQRMNLLK